MKVSLKKAIPGFISIIPTISKKIFGTKKENFGQIMMDKKALITNFAYILIVIAKV